MKKGILYYSGEESVGIFSSTYQFDIPDLEEVEKDAYDHFLESIKRVYDELEDSSGNLELVELSKGENNHEI